MMRHPGRLLSLLLILAGVAAASPQTPQAPAPPHPDDPGGGAAMAWSLLGTAVPMGLGLLWMTNPSSDLEGGLFLMAAGAVIGPSAGQYYARSPIQGSLALAGRAAGMGLLIWGLDENFKQSSCREMRNQGDDIECDDDAGDLPITLGALLIGGNIIYSLVDTELAVKRARVRNAARRGARLRADPWIAYAGPGATRIGGRIQLRF